MNPTKSKASFLRSVLSMNILGIPFLILVFPAIVGLILLLVILGYIPNVTGNFRALPAALAIPRYPNSTSWRIKGNSGWPWGNRSMLILFDTKDSADQVTSYYRRELPRNLGITSCHEIKGKIAYFYKIEEDMESSRESIYKLRCFDRNICTFNIEVSPWLNFSTYGRDYFHETPPCSLQ